MVGCAKPPPTLGVWEMALLASIFFDFSLPNAATWFYFSFLLAHAIFFKFDRLLTLRNWDLFTLYLLVPGLLFLQEAHAIQAKLPQEFRHNIPRSPFAESDRVPVQLE